MTLTCSVIQLGMITRILNLRWLLFRSRHWSRIVLDTLQPHWKTMGWGFTLRRVCRCSYLHRQSGRWVGFLALVHQGTVFVPLGIGTLWERWAMLMDTSRKGAAECIEGNRNPEIVLINTISRETRYPSTETYQRASCAVWVPFSNKQYLSIPSWSQATSNHHREVIHPHQQPEDSPENPSTRHYDTLTNSQRVQSSELCNGPRMNNWEANCSHEWWHLNRLKDN